MFLLLKVLFIYYKKILHFCYVMIIRLMKRRDVSVAWAGACYKTKRELLILNYNEVFKNLQQNVMFIYCRVTIVLYQGYYSLRCNCKSKKKYVFKQWKNKVFFIDIIWTYPYTTKMKYILLIWLLLINDNQTKSLIQLSCVFYLNKIVKVSFSCVKINMYSIHKRKVSF